MTLGEAIHTLELSFSICKMSELVLVNGSLLEPPKEF